VPVKLLEAAPTEGVEIPVVAKEKVRERLRAVQDHFDTGDPPFSTASQTTE